MRRTILTALAVVAVLAATGWATHSATTKPTGPAPAIHQHTGQTAAATGSQRNGPPPALIPRQPIQSWRPWWRR